jgi:hypothetical protein
MTVPLSEKLNHCYSLLFSAKLNEERNRFVKALLCYENCRIESKKDLSNSVYTYCFLRSLRKEAQLLLLLGLKRRAYRLLKREYVHVSPLFHSMDKLLVLAQLHDLSERYSPKESSLFEGLLNQEYSYQANV